MTAEQPPRPRIADIIRESGKMGADQSGPSQDQLAAVVGAITSTPAGVFLASQALTDELAKRFQKLSPSASIEHDFDAPYDVAGRALVLALYAGSNALSAAFDTATGAILEVKKPLSLTSVAFTLTIAVADRGATTHVTIQTQHVGVDWGGQNVKVANELVAKTTEYLDLFKS